MDDHLVVSGFSFFLFLLFTLRSELTWCLAGKKKRIT